MLTSEQIEECRAAARTAGPFPDPYRIRRYHDQLHRVPSDWAATVLGRPFAGPRSDTWEACLTLIRALEMEPHPKPSAAEQEQARQAAEREEAAAAEATRLAAERSEHWKWLRSRLPVPVVVLYNYSGRHHYATYNSGADHIVLEEPLAAGRIRRTARSALCSSPARSRRQEFSDVRLSGDDIRVPTCRACLTTAANLIGGTDAADHAARLAEHSRRARTSSTGR